MNTSTAAKTLSITATAALAQLSSENASELLARRISAMDDDGNVSVVALSEALERGMEIASRWSTDLRGHDDDGPANPRDVRGAWKPIATAEQWIVRCVARWDIDRLIGYAKLIVEALEAGGFKAHASTTVLSGGREIVSVYLSPVGGQRSRGSATLEAVDGEYTLVAHMPTDAKAIVFATWESA